MTDDASSNEDEYISVDEARQILRVTARQVQRHAAMGRVASRREGRRLLLHKKSIEALAQQLGATTRPEEPQEGEIVSDIGPVMDYVRDLTGQLMMMTRRVGELEGQLQNRLLPADEANLRQQVTEYEARIQAMESELIRLRRSQRPWWKRLLG